MIAFCTWLWGAKYDEDDVRKLYRGIKRNHRGPFRFLVMTERERRWRQDEPGIERHAIKDPHLLAAPGCFCRLRMFDPGWQENRGIDDRLVCLDLDIVVTGRLERLFDRPESFVILAGANSVNPCPYNGSVMMLRAGCHPEVFGDFSPEAARRLPFHEFPDDQGWLAHKLPNAATWQAGPKSGIYAFKKPGWPPGTFTLPPDARIVAFPGKRAPKQYENLIWIKHHWV